MTALVFDTETNDSVNPKLIEAAGIILGERDVDPDLINLKPLRTFSDRYNPGAPSTLGALMTHHILDSELVDCPAADTFALPDWTEYLIGHNVDFDWKVIGEPDVKRICTLAMARFLVPHLDSHKLGALCYYIMGDKAREMLKDAHSGAADCEITRWLLRWILVEAKLQHPACQLVTWEDLWAFSEHARIPTTMPFGKHKGCPIAELPGDYVAWFLREQKNKPEGDGDPYLLEALRACA
jgi:exodeoxyribonuclease X